METCFWRKGIMLYMTWWSPVRERPSAGIYPSETHAHMCGRHTHAHTVTNPATKWGNFDWFSVCTRLITCFACFLTLIVHVAYFWALDEMNQTVVLTSLDVVWASKSRPVLITWCGNKFQKYFLWIEHWRCEQDSDLLGETRVFICPRDRRDVFEPK